MAILPYSSSFQVPCDTTNEQEELVIKPRVFPIEATYDVPDIKFQTNSLCLSKIVNFYLKNAETAHCTIQQHQNSSCKIEQSWEKEFQQGTIHSQAFAFYEQARRKLKMNGKAKTINELFIKALKLFIESRGMCVAEKDIFAENVFCCGFIYYHFKYNLHALIHLELAAQICPENESYKSTKNQVKWLVYNISTKQTIEWLDKAIECGDFNHFSKVDLMLCKVEAHAVQGERWKALETANRTLCIMDKSHPSYGLLALKIANR